MTWFRAGEKPGVGTVLKIMRSNSDDPWTTPNNQFHKFAFNSETTQISYLLGIERFDRGGPSVYPSAGGTTGSPRVYTPRANYRVESYVSSGLHVERHYFNFQAAYGLSWWPYVEVRGGTAANDRFEGQYHGYSSSQIYHNSVPYENGAVIDQASRRVGPTSQLVMMFTASNPHNVVLAAVWEFPATNANYTFPSATSTPGQRSLVLTPNRAAMARPGFDAVTGSGRQLIFDSNRIPAKVLAAGQLTLAAGATQDVVIPAAFRPLGPLTYVDAMVRYSSQSDFTMPAFRMPNQGNWWLHGPTFDYRALTDRVRFYSTGEYSVVIRYLIVADDARTTSGGNLPTYRSDDAAGFDQICRPGASNPPRLRDIIIDSRLPYLPIIAEGWISQSGFSLTSDDPYLGSRRAPTVTFANSGFLPFVKFATYMPNDDVAGPPEAYRFHNVPVTPGGIHSKRSVTARVTNTSVRFYASPDAPLHSRWVAQSSGAPKAETISANGSVGCRYYVLGIPN